MKYTNILKTGERRVKPPAADIIHRKGMYVVSQRKTDYLLRSGYQYHGQWYKYNPESTKVSKQPLSDWWTRQISSWTQQKLRRPKYDRLPCATGNLRN